MTSTPLYLCVAIKSTKERRAHAAFLAAGIHSLFAFEVRERRSSRYARRTVKFEAPLLTGYAIVAHDGSPDFLPRLCGLRWRFSELPIVQEVKGVVSAAEVIHLMSITGKENKAPPPPRLSAGARARLIAGPLEGREVRVTVVNGNKVRVEVAGREVSTTMDKLEAA